MDRHLIKELRGEEDSILAALQLLAPYRRLLAVRQLLSLYDDDGATPVGAQFDALLAATAPGAAAAPPASVIALPGPRAEVA
jgi:hypothetical protein